MMTIADNEFTGTDKEEYLRLIRTRIRKCADAETVFRHLWEGLNENKWEYTQGEGEYKRLRIYPHAFAALCGISLKELTAAFLQLVCLGTIVMELDYDPKFFGVWIVKNPEKFCLIRMHSSRNHITAASGRASSKISIEKKKEVIIVTRISDPLISFLNDLGLTTAEARTLWKTSRGSVANLFAALTMSYDRGDSKQRLAKYANWALLHIPLLEEYTRKREGKLLLRAELNIKHIHGAIRGLSCSIRLDAQSGNLEIDTPKCTKNFKIWWLKLKEEFEDLKHEIGAIESFRRVRPELFRVYAFPSVLPSGLVIDGGIRPPLEGYPPLANVEEFEESDDGTSSPLERVPPS